MFSFKVDDRIGLRLLEERHADQLFALLKQNRSHLQAELTWLNDQLSTDDAREYIRAGLNRFADNNGWRAGIWVEESLAGIVSLHNLVAADRRASIGYWLGASFQGQGLVTKACRVLINHAFDELKLNRLEIQCAPDNHRSRRIAERLGFTQEGVLRQTWWIQDRFVDQVVYGLLASEWRDEKS